MFLDLEGRHEQLSQFARNPAGKPAGIYCIAGTIGERTTAARSTPGQLNVDVEASVEPVDVVKRRVNAPFDYVDVDPIPNPNSPPPESYGGMSGGGLFAAIAKDEKVEIWFLGVNFFQSPPTGGGRTITCHFVDSIYCALLKEVTGSSHA